METADTSGEAWWQIELVDSATDAWKKYEVQSVELAFRTNPSGYPTEYSGRKRRYHRIIGTVDGCRTAGGRSSDGRRTVVGGVRVVSGAENQLIEAAPFGRLDQM